MQPVNTSVRDKCRPAHAMQACSREAWFLPGLLERPRSRATGLQKCADRCGAGQGYGLCSLTVIDRM